MTIITVTMLIITIITPITANITVIIAIYPDNYFLEPIRAFMGADQ